MSDENRSTSAESGELVRALSRGLDILRSFSHQHATMSVTEVAEQTQLSRATARRLLLTLAAHGYVQSEHSRYSLRPKVLELGYAYLSSLYPWDAATPVMQTLSATVDENCLAGVLDTDEVVCVARTTRRSAVVSVPVGGRIPAYASSMGRVMLAGLSDRAVDEYLHRVPLRALTRETMTGVAELHDEVRRVRSQGWSLVVHEMEPDVVGIAAPVYDVTSRVVASLNVSAHEHRVSAEDAVTRILPPLLVASRDLSLVFTAVTAHEPGNLRAHA